MSNSENAKSANSSLSDSKLNNDEVDSVVKEFDSEVSKKGIDVASKEYGISGIVSELSEIARIKRESGADYSSIIEGTRIAGTLKKFGAGMPEFEQFLNSVYARSLEKGYTPNEIISQSSKLEALEKKYGMKFEALRANFDELGKSLASKKKEKSDLENEIAQVSKKRADLLARFSLDEQKLSDYANTKQQLAAIGFDVTNLQSVKTALLALKGEGFEAKEIVSKLNSIGDLQEHKSKIQREIKLVKDELDAKKTYLSEIKKLEESKLSFDQIERIRGLVTRISSEHKIEPAQAYTKFEQDVLQNYNTALGLKPETSRLEESRKKLEAEISARKGELDALERSASEKIKKLEAKYSKQKEEIEAYSELRSQGVDGKRILSWDQIITSASLDYGIIEGELRNQANLKNLEDKMSAKIKELLAQELRLTQSISQLNQEKEKIESSIQTIKESALTGIEELRQSVVSSIASLKQQAEKKLEETASGGHKTMDGLRASSEEQIKQVSDIAISDVKTTVSELKTSTEVFSRELKESLAQSSTEIKNVGLALEAGEKIGKYRNILPLLQLIDGSGTQDESEALIAMWNLSSRFNAWLENHYPGEKREISEPLTRLLESINTEIQRVGGA